uniref:RNA-dependent RNA polymerase n=1 Tax=Aspergillus lentulus non-segmented dsRNA virus 1 TaxID=2747490 RepID=A0A7I8CXS8_9VIRU|nr:RNA-dependent RNA polymerase [Aspergillus lentulus non-segmented dsRNA virus 1]
MDLSEDVMVDWIQENPTTVSEASGAGVKEWRFFLKPVKWQRDLPGVESLGQSPGVRYRYVQPATSNSQYFSGFLDERAKRLTGIEGPSVDVVMSEFVPPSEEDLYAHVAGFGRTGPDGSQISTITYAGLLRELREVEDWDHQIADWLEPRHLPKITVPTRTSPGIRWKKLGYKTKKQALMPAVVEATRILKGMLEGKGPYKVPPAGVAGRGKRVVTGTGRSGVKKEGRLIVMPDLVRHLLGTLAAGPYMSELRKCRKEDGGVLLGMGPFSESYQQVSEWAAGAREFLFLDFTGFDQSIPSPLLRAAMAHVQSRFIAGPGTDSYWKSEFEHLVNTEIAMPDGCVYKKKRGVASGDPWTSLADSYANWIALTHISHLLGLKVKVWTFGDDSIVAVYDGPAYGDLVGEFRTLAYDCFGMDVSSKKSYRSRVLVDIEDNPEPKQSGSFLSLYFLQTPMGVRPTRPLQDLYEMFLVPEKNRGDLGWEIVRTSMAYMTFYYNETARYVLEEYWDYLHERYKVPQLRGTADDLALLREMDIPWSSFRWEWLNRLPRPGEVELMYKYGHVGFFQPAQWGVVYSKWDTDTLGNAVSLPLPPNG